MPLKKKDMQYTEVFGNKMALPQHENAAEEMVVTGANNPLPVKLVSGDVGGGAKEIYLQNGATGAGEGTPFDIGGYTTINFKVTGSSTSREIIFEVSGLDGEYEEIQAYRPKDSAMSSHSTGNNESWIVDVTGFETFRARVVSVSGGDITIRGKAVV